MKSCLKDILTRLRGATSDADIKNITNDAIKLVSSNILTDEEATYLTTQIMNSSKQLSEQKGKHSLLEICKIIKDMSFSKKECEDRTSTIENAWGLFREDGVFILARYEKASKCSLGGVYTFFGSHLLDDTKGYVDYLSENLYKIIEINGKQTYVVPALKLFGKARRYYDRHIEEVVELINTYLYLRPDFIPSILEQAENKQIIK